jgi:DELLA protein
MAYQYYPGSSRQEAAGGAIVDGQSRHASLTLQPSDLAQHLGAEPGGNIPGTLQASSNARQGDLTGWIDCMIEELSSNAAGPMAAPQHHHHRSALTKDPRSPNPEGGSSSRDSSLETASPPLPNFAAACDYRVNAPAFQSGAEQQIVPTGDESSGIQLVHSLLACAEAIQRENLTLAEETLHRIQLLGLPPGPMGKVAAHFIDALTRRVYGVASSDSDSLSELLHFHFYERSPYLKFAHFTANQAILEAFAGHKQVHVIDFNLMHGLQWPALIQALALRPGGPPHLRLTGIGPPQPNDVLQEIGKKLRQLADTVKVEFEFRGVVAVKLDDVKPWMLQVRRGEAVAVNSVLQLHKLLFSSVAIDEVLRSVRALNPQIFTVVEHEANHNHPSFLARFTEALHYYSTMFDSLEAAHLPSASTEQLLAEMYLGREISNIVACEHAARTERHENLVQWRLRLMKAGYRPIQLGLNAFKQASTLLTLFSGDGYRVEEKLGCLTLGWHTRPLIAASAWQCT